MRGEQTRGVTDVSKKHGNRSIAEMAKAMGAPEQSDSSPGSANDAQDRASADASAAAGRDTSPAPIGDKPAETPKQQEPDFLSELQAHWEDYGPWVPDENLSEAGLRIKRQFELMLKDCRLSGVFSVQAGDLPRQEIRAPNEQTAKRLYKERLRINGPEPTCKRVA